MNLKTMLILLLLPALLLSSCGSGLPPHIAARFATPSPTPFLPGQAIPDLGDGDSVVVFNEETNGDPWGDYPAPSAPSDVPIPPPAAKLEGPEGQVNILIMGSDQRPNTGGFRTDVIMLVTLTPSESSVSVTSFPRDLYVYEPGFRMDRINSAQARGGFDLMALTFEYNFGVRPDHWLLINFDGFETIIDSLGGIEVQVGRTLTDQREGFGSYTVSAGSTLMDGETALWYVRSRGTSNDFDRTRRQQEVMQALFYRLLSFNAITQAPTLYNSYRQSVTTDLTIGDILPLLPLAGQVQNNGNIHRFAIGSNEVTSYRTTSGAQVLLPDPEMVAAILAAAILG